MDNKKRLLSLMLLLATIVTGARAIEQDGDGTYVIASADDFKAFATLVNSGTNTANARMTADIDLGDDQTMVGDGYYSDANKRKPFRGIFDGQGHTLTVHYVTANIAQKYTDAGMAVPNYIGCAPFGYVWDGTIRNLHTAGTITATHEGVAGIAGWTNGSVLIECCHSSVDITFPENDGHCGGAGISYNNYNNNSVLTITDCIYDGTITAGTNKRSSAGFVVYRAYGTVNIYNSLMAGSFGNGLGTSDCATFVRNHSGTISNCYYKTALGTVQGTLATADELANGRTAFYLQNSRDAQVWGQLIGTDAHPVLTNDEAKRVYRDANGYTNTPSTYAGLQQDDEGNYLISGNSDWEEFCALTQTTPTACAKMTADVTVNGNAMVGTQAKPYAGTFDGQGHTLTVNYDRTGLSYSQSMETGAAPFLYINVATIRDLHTAGTIRTSTKFAAGVVGEIHGLNNLIERCRSSVLITSTVDGEGCMGGIVSQMPNDGKSRNFIIRDCLFDGHFDAPKAWGNGGIMGFKNGDGTFVNCLYAPTGETAVGTNQTYTIVRHTANALTITNCYYAEPMGTVQGTEAKADYLAIGRIAHKLQADRDDQVWGQLIGTDPYPILTTDADRHVYFGHEGYTNTPTTYEGLQQDADGYYLIGWDEELKVFASMVNDDGMTHAKAKLTQDIDLGTNAENRWTAIGQNDHDYAGTFDGQGHIVSGLYAIYGLFRTIAAGGTVQNLIVEGTVFGTDYLDGGGGIAAANKGVVTRCGFRGSVSGSTSADAGDVGGIVGNNYGLITNCFNQGKVSGRYLGGISGAGTGTGIQNCYNSGQLTNTYTSGSKYSNAISGRGYGNVSHCYELEGCISWHGSEGVGGTVLTRQEFYGGKATYLLQQGQSEQIWGQVLGTDEWPMLTSAEEQKVYQLSDTKYSNSATEETDFAIPYAAWTEGNTTLSFFGSNEILKAGNTRGGQTITAIWALNDVTSTPNDGEPKWNTYYGNITTVDIDESFATVEPTIFRAWFWNCSNLTTINGLANLNTSKATTLRSMFGNCAKLTELDLSAFDTRMVNETYQMFLNCSQLKTIIINNGWDMSNVTNSTNMFGGCTSIVGEDGTTYNESSVDVTRAHSAADGYLTMNNLELAAKDGGDGTYYATYYTSYMNRRANDGTEVYTATVSDDGTKLDLTLVDDGIVKAGQGVVLTRTADQNIVLTRTADESAADYSANVLEGVDKATSTAGMSGTLYVLSKKAGQNVGFYRYVGTTLDAHKAYLQLSADAARQLEWLPFDDGETTSLSDELRMMNDESADAVWYTLDGRKLNGKPAKAGLYIMNGKKTVVK